MAELFYFKSSNDFFLIECKKVGKTNYHYFECLYSNGIDEIVLVQNISRDIPTLITYKRMERILLNDKSIETPEYFT